jgi:hypothetical protein
MASRIRTKEDHHISSEMSMRFVKRRQIIYVVRTGDIVIAGDKSRLHSRQGGSECKRLVAESSESARRHFII